MILVTGATGFVGRHIVAALKQQGAEPVRCLVHRQAQGFVLQEFGVELVYGDVRDPAAMQKAVEGARAVVHLVATIREGKRWGTFESVNRQGTRNLVNAAKEAGVEYFVYMSAQGAQENPKYRYAYSKWQAEQEVIRSGLRFVVFRPSSQFGPGDAFLNVLAALVRLSPIVLVAGRGDSRFQLIAVEDVARCVAVEAYGRAHQGQIVELGGPDQLAYNGLVDLVAEALQMRRRKVHIPVPLMGVLAAFLEVVSPRPVVTREQLSYLEVENITALDSVERQFGFKPRPVRGSIGYLTRVGWLDALRIQLGFFPSHVRDH